MAANVADTSARPRWPDAPLGSARPRVHDNPLAHEAMIVFDDAPEAYVDPLDAPDFPDAAILVALGSDEDDSGDVGGVQVDHLLDRAGTARPAWRALADGDPPAAAVAMVVADVKELCDRSWTPPPPR